jgi:hypothetical protein
MKQIQYVDVIVDRGTTKIPTTIPLYELPVLQAIHNQDTTEGLIEHVESHEPYWRDLGLDDEGDEIQFNAQDAYDNLRRKYDTMTCSPAKFIYRAGPSDLARAVDVRTVNDEPKPSPEVSPEVAKRKPGRPPKVQQAVA